MHLNKKPTNHSKAETSIHCWQCGSFSFVGEKNPHTGFGLATRRRGGGAGLAWRCSEKIWPASKFYRRPLRQIGNGKNGLFFSPVPTQKRARCVWIELLIGFWIMRLSCLASNTIRGGGGGYRERRGEKLQLAFLAKNTSVGSSRAVWTAADLSQVDFRSQLSASWLANLVSTCCTVPFFYCCLWRHGQSFTITDSLQRFLYSWCIISFKFLTKQSKVGGTPFGFKEKSIQRVWQIWKIANNLPSSQNLATRISRQSDGGTSRAKQLSG